MFVSTKADAISQIINKGDYSPKYYDLVLIPTFTANAYKSDAFYDYYSGQCSSVCLTADISQSQKLGEAGSQNVWNTLHRLGYEGINDYIVDYYLRSDPDFLSKYHTVIILHNEYVTQSLYNAILKHPNVVYLAPNALYAKISLDHSKMTLESGHGYNGKNNAFDWKYDNTIFEYDKKCNDWKFIKIGNGYQLNCNPELIINKKPEILKALREL